MGVISFFRNMAELVGIRGNFDSRHALRLIFFTTSLRIIYLFIFPLGLVGDESYYWEWGRNLDWGYYSKPPFIGWLMGMTSWMGADTAPWVRVPAALLGGATLIMLHRLGCHLFTPKIAFWGTIFLLLSPALSAVSLIISIDAPLLFFWSSSMLSFWIVFYEKKSPIWIIILIVSLGFGNLTKQMMLLFPLLGFITILLDSSKRYILVKPWIWIGWLCTLAFLIPSIWWNWSNDWITLKHTASHLNRGSFTLNERILSFFEFIISESFLIGPVLFVGAIISLWKLIKSKDKNAQIRFLLVFSFPAFIIFVCLSFSQKVNPNWPAVFYLPIVLLTAKYFIERPINQTLKWWKNFQFINTTSSTFLLCLIYFSVFAFDLFNLNGSRYDLFKRLRGYNDYAKQVIEIKNSIANKDDLEIIVIGHRYDLCQLAFAGPGNPKVHGYWDKKQGITSQYDIWARNKELGQKDALVVLNISEKIPDGLYEKFRTITLLDRNIRIPFPVGKQLFFDLYHAQMK